MKRKAAFRVALFLSACFLLFLPAYADYDVLTESDFLSATVKYENVDLKDMPFDKQVNICFTSAPVSASLPLQQIRNLAPASLCPKISSPSDPMNCRC